MYLCKASLVYKVSLWLSKATLKPCFKIHLPQNPQNKQTNKQMPTKENKVLSFKDYSAGDSDSCGQSQNLGGRGQNMALA